MRVFEFVDYKELIRAQIAANKKVRGYQTKLADAARCQRPFFSQMLSSSRDLTHEQAMRLAQFWQFDPDETDYFLNLVTLARSEYPALRQAIQRRLRRLKESNELVSERLKGSKSIKAEDEHVYYSSWIYAALHMLTGIEGQRTVPTMSTALQLHPQIVSEALRRLSRMGFVEPSEEGWTIRAGHYHLGVDSPFLPSHHSNWRQRAVLDSQRKSSDSVHYTVVQTHAVSVFNEIKSALLRTIEKNRQIIAPSPNEEATCLCIDFFRI